MRNKQPTEQRPLLTVAEVAKHLQVSEREVRRYIEDEELKIVRLGRLVRIRWEDLEAFVTDRLE